MEQNVQCTRGDALTTIRGFCPYLAFIPKRTMILEPAIMTSASTSSSPSSGDPFRNKLTSPTIWNVEISSSLGITSSTWSFVDPSDMRCGRTRIMNVSSVSVIKEVASSMSVYPEGIYPVEHITVRVCLPIPYTQCRVLDDVHLTHFQRHMETTATYFAFGVPPQE